MESQFPGAALQFLEITYGGPVSEAQSAPVTGAALASVLVNDPDALQLIFINTGAFPVFLHLRQDDPPTQGIQLGANGGGTTMNVREDGTLPCREWFANSPGGASSLYILRIRRYSRTQPAQGGA
jgi:hypothetical protein